VLGDVLAVSIGITLTSWHRGSLVGLGGGGE
jgi:hypothetical protein